jgi:hypothetical protein
MSLTFKRHYHLIVLLTLAGVLLILGLGDQRIVAYTLQGNAHVVEQGIYLARSEISSVLFTLGIH